MRPLHALLLVAVLAIALLTGLFLIGTGDRSGVVAPPLADAPGARATRTETPLESLDGASTSAGANARAAKASSSAPSTEPGAPAKAGERSLLLRGRVVSASGQPVANATIFAAPVQGLAEIALDEIDPKDMPWMRRVETQSGADGRFTIAPEAQSSIRLAVRASGFAPHDAEVPVKSRTALDTQAQDPNQDIGDVVLEQGVVLSGRVVDSAGRAVANAELRQRKESRGIVMLGGPRGPLLATSDDQGRFTIDRLASGAWKIAISSDEHPDKVESGETERPGSSVTNLQFVLEDGAEIQGRVLDAPPASIANLWVRAALRPSGPGDEASGQSFAAEVSAAPFASARKAKCAADGSFTLRGLKKGQSYRLVAREGESNFGGGRTRTQALQVKAGDRGVQLRWKPETALVGQVVDAVTGAPITELNVEAGYGWNLPLMGEDGRPVKHFDDGRVRFANLPQKAEGQTATIAIDSAGYQRFERKGLDPIEGQDLDLGVIRLERAPLVKVLVLDDASGAPIAGASVSLEVEDPQGSPRKMILSLGDADEDGDFGPGRGQRARTDAEGRASVTSLPGQKAVLRVRHKGHAMYAGAPKMLPLAGDLEETVRLRVGGTVVVEVVDAKERPVPGQSIEHLGPDGREAPLSIGDDTSEQTDASGKVAFEHLEAGTHRFRLRNGANDMISMGGGAVVRMVKKGGDTVDRGSEWSDADGGERTTSNVRLVAPARSSLTGRVTESGKPLAGATVRLTDKKSGSDAPDLPFFDDGREARTNGKGDYTLENAKAGEYRVIVSHASRAMPFETSVRLREGDNKLDVELSVCTIEGRVTNADGKPLAGIRVRAERPQAPDSGKKSRVMVFATANGDDNDVTFSMGPGGAEPALTDADGKYKLRGVPPDVDLVVKATGKDVQPGESSVVKLSADQTKSGVDLSLQQGGSIEVTVQYADGRPGSSCLVRGRIEGDSVDPKNEFSGTTGIVKLTGLKPGKWHLTVTPIGPGAPGEKPDVPEQLVEVKAGEAGKAHFEIP